MSRFSMKPGLFLFVFWAALSASLSASTLNEEKEILRHAAVETLIEQMGLQAAPRAVSEMPGWRKPEKVVIRLLRPEGLEELQAVAPGVEIVAVYSLEEALAALDGAQALLGFCNEEILAAGHDLHWIQVYSAGVERCVELPGLQQENILLTNGQRIGSPGLAEHAIAMMMALARGLDVYHRNQVSEGKWIRESGLAREQHMELAGRTVLIVGLGGIGTQTARRAHGLGMRVIATRGSRRDGPDYVDYVGLADEAGDLAAQADVVINTAPLTDRTRGMFDAAFFKAMKPTAYFVSVGRGASTKTDDLVAALRNGDIAGAGLDVTDPEPLPAGHPLWSLPRVIISPHTAGRTDKGRDRLFLMMQENLRRYVAGEAMLSVVGIKRGY